MAGENTDPGPAPTQAEAVKLWNDVAAEREQDPAGDAASDTTFKTAEPEPATEPAQAAVEALAPAEPADPFAGLSAQVVERLKRLEVIETQVAQLPTLQRSLSEAQGRVAAMQREMAEAKTAAKAVDSAPTAAQIAAASKSTEKWGALKSDFPEWADATEEYVKASIAGLTPHQSAGLTPEQVEQRINERVQAALQETEHEKVSDAHGGWQATVKTNEFQTWFRAQDTTTQALAASVKARDAIRMLDLFQRAKAAPADQVAADRNNRLAAAVTTRPTATAKAGGKTPEQMTPAELWEYERKASVNRAKATGLTY